MVRQPVPSALKDGTAQRLLHSPYLAPLDLTLIQALPLAQCAETVQFAKLTDLSAFA